MPLRDEEGKTIGTFGITKDITESKQVREEIEALAKFPRENPNPVLRISKDGTVLYSNKASTPLLDTWGYKEGQPIPDKWQQLVQDTLDRGEGQHIEIECVDRVLTLFFSPIVESNYANVYALYITEPKRSEEALRKSEEQLRQAQKLESIGRLAGGVAHDFNNLLTTIIGYSELISMEQDLNDSTKEGVQEIKNSAKRAAELTKQLLAFSRKQVLQPQVIDLNRLITKLGKMLRRLIGEDVDLTTKLDSKPGHIKADPGQVEQVITNLVVNARDAMQEGGTITIETQGLYLDESYSQQHPEVKPGDYVLLAVSDTGHGMDEETQAQIFEPFFTTKEVGKGTGLGLSTVYGIVKQSGGYIYVYSEPDHGTTFKIYLPQLTGARKQQESVREKKGPMGGTETILLVEDEESLRKMAGKILDGYGYSVVEAKNGMEALEIITQGDRLKIDLLVTDVIMPKMGGKELAGKLTEEYPKLKVLYISGYTDNAIAHHGELDKGVSLLQKPFSTQSLAEKVREVLDES
ncbi:MAG TPA: response regulator [Spirochaetales bacterium]|nr:response regulator [Spirochaetales bacterium]